MQIVAIINQKGGAGKSTVAIHLAAAAAQEERNVVLIDLDGQASSAEWGDRRDADLPAMISCHAGRLKHELAKVRELGGDLVILDTVPRAESTVVEAARFADLVIIPTEPNILEIQPTVNTVELLRRSTDTPFFIVLNKVAISGPEADDAEEWLRDEHRVSVCPVRLVSRKAYWRSITDGLGVTEYEPDEPEKNRKAAHEVSALYTFMSEQLQACTPAPSNTLTEEADRVQA